VFVQLSYCKTGERCHLVAFNVGKKTEGESDQERVQLSLVQRTSVD